MVCYLLYICIAVITYFILMPVTFVIEKLVHLVDSVSLDNSLICSDVSNVTVSMTVQVPALPEISVRIV
jgi:hypothetical protein